MDTLSVWVEDLRTTSDAIYYSFLIAFLLGIVYLLFTRVFAGVIVWVSIILFFVAISLLTYLCWTKHLYYQLISDNITAGVDVSMYTL
jgi:solute carrier family 44 protein 1 (choline transporter-like protein)/choline transporter-like protein 2/4/5